MSFLFVLLRWSGREAGPAHVGGWGRGQDDSRALALVQARYSQGEMYKYLLQSQTCGCRASFPTWSPLFGDTGVHSGDLAVWVLVGHSLHVQCLVLQASQSLSPGGCYRGSIG